MDQKAPAPDDEKGPIYMLNVLWFKPDGGRGRYMEYIAAAGPLVAKHGGRPLPGYVPRTAVIGDFDADLVFFVEWPSWRVFTEFAGSAEYSTIAHLREDAITKSLLIRCDAFALEEGSS